MPWRPNEPGERPTLGPYVLRWIKANLIIPDGPLAGRPLVFTPEQQRFVMRFYELDPHGSETAVVDGALRNARRVRRAVLSRPKGWGKSPLVAALCITEALADVVPAGWDANGRPVSRSWASLGFKPKTQVVAVSEDQTVNTWDPLLEMCREGPVAQNYRIEPLETFVTVPRGRIEFTTSAARSREGFRPVFSAMDQTESWTPSIGGPQLAATIRRNLTKTGGSSIETPNAFIPGEESVAEKSWEAWQLQQEGKLKTGGILFDHREAPPETDPSDRDSLLAGLAYAYGDSSWVDLDRVVADYWDPNTDPQDARHFYLNQITHASDSWITQPEWAGCVSATTVVADRSMITLGFDGSAGRTRGVADSTALIGCELKTGHIFELGMWEQPKGAIGKGWKVPRTEVDAAVRGAFTRYAVIGFYGDPAGWTSEMAAWEATYHARLKVGRRDHPIEWWINSGRSGLVVRALESFHAAVVGHQLNHDGSSALTRHVLNTRRRPGRSGMWIDKEHRDSERKIDGTWAAVLAWQARLDALAKGVGAQTAGVARRIR